MRRVLCVRRGALGDTLLMVPVLRALARAHAGAELHFAGVRDFAVLLAHHGLAAQVWSSEDLWRWPPARWRDYDCVLADDPAWCARAAPGTARAFEPRPQRPAPLAQQIADQLGLALHWPHDAWLRERAQGTAPLLLAPGSGGRAKCWPTAHWLALAAALPAQPLDVLVGPVERERDDPRRWPWPRAVGFVDEPDVLAMAARVAVARAFVGNDSGPTHLAAMLAVPTVALFGPSDAAVFAPNGPRVRVLAAPAAQLTALAPAVVQAALRALGVA